MFSFLPSSEESYASSGLSMNSSAGVRSPADGLDAGSGPKVEPLDVSLLGQNLETLKGKNHTSQKSLQFGTSDDRLFS